MVPGLRYRRRANGSIVLSHAWPIRGLIPGCRTRRIPNLPSQAHPGLTCLGAHRTVAPTRTLLTLPPQPERYLIRLLWGQGHSMG